MRVLVLSSVYPNPRQPTLGVFVRARMERVGRHCELRVVAPVPWFPLNRLIRGRQWADIPRVESQHPVAVYHPRIFSVPRYLKWLDGAFYAASLVPFLARLRREFPFDLIDAHFAYPDGLGAALLGKLLRRPVVITLRGSIVRLATYPLHRPQLRFALRAATRVLSVSESLKRVAVGLGIPEAKIRVIPNGVDAGRFFPADREEARRALGLPPDRPILLSVGAINEGKGHHRVLGILAEVIRHHPDLLHVIVGTERPGDTVRPLLERLIARDGLGDHVLLVGERPHEEIPRWLAAADVFCLASRSEGRANVLLESLACGRPVVSTNVGGSSEIITDPDLGFLVRPDDDEALARAVRDALGRHWDRDALVRHARLHSWDATTAAVLEEFRRVTAGGSAEPGLTPVDSPQASHDG